MIVFFIFFFHIVIQTLLPVVISELESKMSIGCSKNYAQSMRFRNGEQTTIETKKKYNLLQYSTHRSDVSSNRRENNSMKMHIALNSSNLFFFGLWGGCGFNIIAWYIHRLSINEILNSFACIWYESVSHMTGSRKRWA